MANFEQKMSTPSWLVHRLPEDRPIAVHRGTPAEHPQLVCTKCQWSCARPSRRRNGIDFLVAFFLLLPFRCRSCHRRFYRFSFLQPKLSFRPPSETNAHSKRKDYQTLARKVGS
jgi:hypothetical protein